MYEQMDEWMVEWMDGRMYEQIMKGWMDRSMDEWRMDGWMNGIFQRNRCRLIKELRFISNK